MTDDRKHQLLRLAGTTDAMPEHELRNDLFNLSARTEAQFNQRGDTIADEDLRQMTARMTQDSIDRGLRNACAEMMRYLEGSNP